MVESKNDITFYWKPSKLATFYNLYSTDELGYIDREPVIRKAVDFLTSNVNNLPLSEELLAQMQEPSTLLGFYEGFPIFGGSMGFARLQSRLGVHVDSDSVMISTPLDKYEADVYELAELLANVLRMSLRLATKLWKQHFPYLDFRTVNIFGNRSNCSLSSVINSQPKRSAIAALTMSLPQI